MLLGVLLAGNMDDDMDMVGHWFIAVFNLIAVPPFAECAF